MNIGKLFLKYCFLTGALLISALLFAASESSPAGYWKTFDLEKTPRSVVKFTIKGDELLASIVKIIPNKKDAENSVCSKCEGSLKNKPLVGMQIIWGVKKSADDNKWTDGYVLDTDSGNTYRCNVWTSEDGKTLYMHGYAGIPIFGKTVEWQHVSETEFDN